jgi:restriction endonuclease S subunit
VNERKLKPGWKMVRFGGIAQNIVERIDPANARTDVYVGLEHLDPTTLHLRRWGHPRDVSGEKLVFQKGDTIFGKRRAYQRKLALAEFDGICSAHAMVLRPHLKLVLPEFFPFFLQSNAFMDRAVEISVGSLSPTINWGTLRDQEFALPPIEEQKRIAEILWAADKAEERYLAVIAKVDTLQRSYISDIVSDHSYPSIPLNEVVNTLNGYAFKSKNYTRNGIRIIRINNVQKGSVVDGDSKFYPNLDSENLHRYALREKDLLVSLTGNVGRVGRMPESLLPAALNQRVACLRSRNQRIDMDFLFWLLNYGPFEKDCIGHSNGSAQKNLSTVWLGQYGILLPTIEKQRSLSVVLEQLEHSVAKLKLQIKAFRTIGSALMKQTIENAGGDDV